MKTINELEWQALKDHLLKNWMTHDAMWFFQVFQNYGITAANALNKASIKALAALEIQRARQLLGLEQEPPASFPELKTFIDAAFSLSTGKFMGFHYEWPQENILRWSFADQACFAYRGMRRLGVADQYECGVLYRVLSWLDVIGVQYEVSPPITGCLQHQWGKCAGEVRIFFS